MWGCWRCVGRAIRARRGRVTQRKGRYWIQWVPVRCRDWLHHWLMREAGFERYLAERMWEITRPAELPPDLRRSWPGNGLVRRPKTGAPDTYAFTW